MDLACSLSSPIPQPPDKPCKTELHPSPAGKFYWHLKLRRWVKSASLSLKLLQAHTGAQQKNILMFQVLNDHYVLYILLTQPHW